MSKKMWFLLWGGLFVLCAALGFLPEPVCAPSEDGGVCWLRVVMTILSVAFFLPPAVLLHQAGREKNVPMQQLIRNLSALSLGLTLVMLILNFWSARDTGQRAALCAGGGIYPHDLQRAMGAEPVFVGLHAHGQFAPTAQKLTAYPLKDAASKVVTTW